MFWSIRAFNFVQNSVNFRVTLYCHVSQATFRFRPQGAEESYLTVMLPKFIAQIGLVDSKQ